MQAVAIGAVIQAAEVDEGLEAKFRVISQHEIGLNPRCRRHHQRDFAQPLGERQHPVAEQLAEAVGEGFESGHVRCWVTVDSTRLIGQWWQCA